MNAGGRHGVFAVSAVIFAATAWPGCKLTCGSGGTHFTSSAAAPEELASHEPGPRRALVDDRHLYWTVWGNGMTGDRSKTGLVKRVDKTGKGKVEVFATAQSHPAGIAADATTVYWTTEGDGNVMKLAKSGGAPSVLTADVPDPESIAVDATGVYVSGHGEIFKTDAAGAKPTSLAKLHGTARRMVLDDRDVFYVDNKAEIGKVPKLGGAATVLATGGESKVMFDAFIAIDDTTVYFANDKDLMGVPKAGGAAKKVARCSSSIRGITTDGTSVFTLDSNEILRVPVAGGKGVRIADTSSPSLLELDGTHAYWFDGIMDQKVLRHTK